MFDIIIDTYYGVYELCSQPFGYGWGLFILSLVTVILMHPLQTYANKYRDTELKIRLVIDPQISKIKQNYFGHEQWSAVNRLYKRYRYHPLYAIRSALGPLIQLPFLFAAFCMLSQASILKGLPFFIIKDLSVPDTLLFGQPVLPIIMFGINVLNTGLGDFSKKERLQAVALALFFLVLLYKAPAGLLIYWTTNNAIGLLQTVFQKYLKSDIKFSSHRVVKILIFSIAVFPLYLWANNPHYYNPSAAIFIIITTYISVLLFSQLINIYIISPNATRILIFFSFALFLFMGQTVLCSLGTIDLVLTLLAVGILFIASLFFLNTKILSIGITIFFAVTLALGMYNFGHLQKNKINNLFILPAIELNYKPNIYLIVCESYNDLSVMNDKYGISTKKFENYLNSRIFFIHDNVYSNGDYTLATLLNLVTMNSRVVSYGKADTSQLGREIIGGALGNNLFKILKGNGYSTTFMMHGDNYFFEKKGEFLDFSDVKETKLIDKVLAPLFDSNSLLRKVREKYSENETRNQQKSDIQIIEDFLQNKALNPQFFMTKIGADHTPSVGYDYQKREEWVTSGKYQLLVESSMKRLTQIIDKIIESDPDSMIIMIGDHGSWRLRGIDEGAQNIEDLKKRLTQIEETFKDYVEDKFYIFCAIHYPNTVLPIKGNITPANLFNLLFTELAPTKKNILKNWQTPNYSYSSSFKLRVVVDDGRLVE